MGLDARWRAYEFKQLFDSIDYLSKVYAIKYKLRRESPDFRLQRGMTRSPVYRQARLYYYLAPHEELQVRQVKFASPGLVSFEGIGDVIKEVRELVDYVVTGEWVKRFIDNYHQIRDRELWEAQRRARVAEASAQTADAQARRLEAALREIEARSKIKQAIRTMRKRPEEQPTIVVIGLEKLDDAANVAIELEARKLARLEMVEDSIVQSLSILHRLGSEQQKMIPEAADRDR